jgi:hypothetical protein
VILSSHLASLPAHAGALLGVHTLPHVWRPRLPLGSTDLQKQSMPLTTLVTRVALYRI